MRRGLATLPVSLGKSSAYLASNVSHGIRSASLIQRLYRFMWRPKGWLKSRKECCSLSIGLYIVLAPICSKSVKNCKKKRFVFVKILAIIIPENRAIVSKIKCLRLNQQKTSSGFPELYYIPHYLFKPGRWHGTSHLNAQRNEQ